MSKRDYTTEERERGLAALVKNVGNSARAAKELKQAGLSIPERTLRDWRNITYADQYRDARHRYESRLKEELGEEILADAREDLDASAKARERFLGELRTGNVPARDLAGAARNFATAGGIKFDKATTLRGEPTETVRHEIDLLLINKAIAAIEGSIEGEAEEIYPEVSELLASLQKEDDK